VGVKLGKTRFCVDGKSGKKYMGGGKNCGKSLVVKLVQNKRVKNWPKKGVGGQIGRKGGSRQHVEVSR